MSKKKIIILSVVVGVLALILILFGAVFRLRKQTVTYSDGGSAITSSEIISTAGFNYGASIFMLDKDGAIEQLESKYPYLKVVQIKTKSVIEIEFIVRARYETYYAYNSSNNSYYILDEDLKVLRTDTTQPTDLTFIDTDLGITSNTVVCDFVGTEKHQNIISSLYSAMYKTVKINDEYLTREGIISLVTKIEFDTGAYILNGDTILYDRVILTTSYGTVIDIGMPESDLDYKVNLCFSALGIIADDGKSDSGTIKCVYLDGGEVSFRYDVN